MMYTYFSQFFGVNIMADTKLSKVDYSILDKLVELPFSADVKKEIHLRVKLQKQYCYDANGSFHSLDRFLKETINYVISKKQFKDFKMLNFIKNDQLDYSYMLNCAAKHNEIKSIKFIQKKLLSVNSTMLNEAMIYAVKSQSFEVSVHLMKQKINLDENTQKIILNEFAKEEFDIFYNKLSDTKMLKLLPNHKRYNTYGLRKRIKKDTTFDYKDYGIYGDFEDNLYDIVYNSILDMYNQYFIDDFTVELYQHKVYVKVWNHSNIYSIDFFDMYEKILRVNGFKGWQEKLSLKDEEESKLKKEIEFLVQRDTRIHYEGEILANIVDNYDFINMEVL